jgi:hypothetical protein
MSENETTKPCGFQPGNTYGKGRPLGSRNATPPISKDQLLRDIEELYNYALSNSHWNIALQAKSLQGKLLGLFRTRKLPDITHIADMNEGELEDFLARFEAHDPSLKELKLLESNST